MTARKPVQLSYEALHRIRLAAGAWPADLEIYDLGRQICKAIAKYHSLLSLRDIKTQKARLKAIHKTASKLAALLKTDEKNGVLDWCSQWPKDLPSPSKVAKELQRMIENLRGPARLAHQAIGRQLKAISPQNPVGLQHQIPVNALPLSGMLLNNESSQPDLS